MSTATRTPTATSVTPPDRPRGGGRAPIHTPEVIAEIALGAKEGWTSNGLRYKSKSSAQAAAQRVKGLLVEGGYYPETSSVRSTVYEDGDAWIFAVRER